MKHGEVYIRINGRRETKQAIQRNLKQRLGNITAETPMMKGQLAKSLGPFCENAEVRSAILSGEIRLDGEDDDMILMLRILSENTSKRKVDFSITRQDYAGFWKGARESTSSSQSRRHFGHYKAEIGCNLLEDVHSMICDTACRMATP